MPHRLDPDAPGADEKANQQPVISSGSGLPQEGLLSGEPGGEPLEQSLQSNPEFTLPFGGQRMRLQAAGISSQLLVTGKLHL